MSDEFLRFPDLVALGREADVSPDSLLWNAGDPGDEVVLLMSGTLDVVQHSADGEEVVLRTLQAGSILGEIAGMDGLTRSAAVRANTRSHILRVPAAAFRDLVRARPDILEELFWQQVRRVRSLTEEVVRTHRRSIIDRLTKAYEPGFFKERLRSEIERAREAHDPLSVIVFDVDNLTEYNDANGRTAGNDLLAALADTIRQTSRRGDVVARLGGEEFSILLYGSEREDAREHAEKVRTRIASTEFPGGAAQPLGRVTVSAGVATSPEDGTRVDTLLEAADACLATAKEHGRNRTVARVDE